MSNKTYLIKNGVTVLTENPNKFLDDGWVHKTLLLKEVRKKT